MSNNAPERMDYFKQAADAVLRFTDACNRRRQADQDMAKFRKLAIALSEMLSDDEAAIIRQDIEAAAVVGFTDTIKQLFRQAQPNPLTPLQVRAMLQGAGYDLSGQSNPMASIHSVLRRLLTSGHIVPNGNPDFGGYRWNNPNPDDDVYKSGVRDWDTDQRRKRK